MGTGLTRRALLGTAAVVAGSRFGPRRAGSDASTTVVTRQGSLRGRIVDDIHVFKGVPFAAPPFGANRLRPPQPVAPWAGVRDASSFGPKSPQPPYPPVVQLLLPESVGQGEDCLTLNVWTPDPGAAGLPVMVWVPGGMFEFHGTGASPWYDGGRFARDGVVCVTISYRVGAEGFLFLDDGLANLGLLDQIAALRWVQEHIDAFGGDPGNVTVFGESAGAMCVGTLLAVPRAAGLFRRAIAESGGAQQVLPAAAARRVAERLAARLGVPPNREALAAVPVERWLAAQTEVDGELAGNPDPARWGPELAASRLAWQPVIDGEVLPAPPLDRIGTGSSADVDLLVGSNTDEFNLFLVTDGSIDLVTPEMLAGVVGAYGLKPDTALAAYRGALPGSSPGELLSAVQGDWWFRVPALRLAEAHAPGPASTHLYEFAWRSPQFGGRLGACHALEIPFVFDTLGHDTEVIWGPTPPQSLADEMHAAWVGFATSGRCNWPRYDLDQRATMRFGTPSRVVDDPQRTARTLWAGVR